MKEYLRDTSNAQQSVLLLMNIKDGLRHWRLNYNITEILPTESGEESTNQGVQYECDFVPDEGGIEGNPPAFELFEQYLIERGLTYESIEQIRADYNGFVDANEEAFLEEIV